MQVFIEYNGAWVPLERLEAGVADDRRNEENVLEDEEQWDS
jgi:hypothetical protein